MRCLLASAFVLLAAGVSAGKTPATDYGLTSAEHHQKSKEKIIEANSLHPPYISDFWSDGLPEWEFYGSTVVTDHFVRLTPDSAGKKGAVWNYQSMSGEAGWEVSIGFRVSSSRAPPHPIGADGFALWMIEKVPTVVEADSLFGAPAKFRGLGIIFDSYDNDYKKDNPAINVIYNEAKAADEDLTNFNTETDFLGQAAGRCQYDFRNSLKPDVILARIVYENNGLKIYMSHSNSGAQEQLCCQVSDVALPKWFHLGLTADTGGVSDNHDIYFLHTVPVLAHWEAGHEDYDHKNDHIKDHHHGDEHQSKHYWRQKSPQEEELERQEKQAAEEAEHERRMKDHYQNSGRRHHGDDDDDDDEGADHGHADFEEEDPNHHGEGLEERNPFEADDDRPAKHHDQKEREAREQKERDEKLEAVKAHQDKRRRDEREREEHDRNRLEHERKEREEANNALREQEEARKKTAAERDARYSRQDGQRNNQQPQPPAQQQHQVPPPPQQQQQQAPQGGGQYNQQPPQYNQQHPQGGQYNQQQQPPQGGQYNQQQQPPQGGQYNNNQQQQGGYQQGGYQQPQGGQYNNNNGQQYPPQQQYNQPPQGGQYNQQHPPQGQYNNNQQQQGGYQQGGYQQQQPPQSGQYNQQPPQGGQYRH